ncbi:MAG: hypothetical protein JXR26_08390 [Balneolaceae bacterium]|nr:hypothetical protein [Balneolaceae bacterium]
MSTNKDNNDIERKIDQYVNGQLSEEEIDNLWAEMIQSQESMDYLNTTANLKEVVGRKKNVYRRKVWMYAAAAVIVLILAIVGTMQYMSPNTSAIPSPIENIELDYYRSAEAVNEADRDKVIRNAIELYNNDQFKEAVDLLNKERSNTSDVSWIAELDITLGTFHYNEDKFDEAAFYFADVINYKDQVDVLTLEKAYWYLGNSYLQMNQLSKAERTMEKAYELNGAYSRVAKSFLNAIADARSKQSL